MREILLLATMMEVLMLLPRAEKHERLISENEGSDHVSLPLPHLGMNQ